MPTLATHPFLPLVKQFPSRLFLGHLTHLDPLPWLRPPLMPTAAEVSLASLSGCLDGCRGWGCGWGCGAGFRLGLNPGSATCVQHQALGRRLWLTEQQRGRDPAHRHTGSILVERSGAGFPGPLLEFLELSPLQASVSLWCWLRVVALFCHLWPCSGAGSVGQASSRHGPFCSLS